MEASTRRSGPPVRCGGVARRAGRLTFGVLAALALSAIMWTWLAASAAAADQSPAPRVVKYYIVPRTGHGPANLFDIAAQTLGDSARFMQIFKINKGRLQPNGGRLENPKVVEAGWVLQLPPDAAGRGVHFGTLPRPNPSTRPTPHPRPRSSPSSPLSQPRAAPSSSTAGFVVADLALVIVGGLAVAGGLVLPRKGRRRRIAGPSRVRGPDHAEPLARTPERVLPGSDVADPAHRSWRTDAVLPADWPADHPSRPQQAVDYRGWPADHPSRPQQAVDYQGWPHHGPGGPGAGAVRGQPVPAGFAAPAPAPHHHSPAPHYPPAPRHSPPPHHPAPPPPLPAQANYPSPTAPPGAPWSTDTLRVASLLISEAEAEANKIRAEATAVREEAAAQAAAVREAAEQQAEGLRSSLQAMSTELGEVAAFVTERLTIPGAPIAPDTFKAGPSAPADPTATPTPAPPASANAAPTRVPTRKRAPTPPTKPGKATKPSKPAKPSKPTKPGQRPRQVRAIRMLVAACIGLSLFAAVSGTTEIFLHGFSFFVFRSAGTGATPGSGLQEDQGPGQPDAPGTHHIVTPHHKAKQHKTKHLHHRPVNQHGG